MTETRLAAPGAAPGAVFARARRYWNELCALAVRLRETALGGLGFALLLIVAGSGWALSFSNLHDYGVTTIGLGAQQAWLVPVVFDLAPLGLSIVVYRAQLQGRGGLAWRAGVWAFAALSSWINWIHAPATGRAQIIAALLPIAAVVLFEGLMHETRRSALERLYGGVVPRLTLACWALAPRATFHAFRVKALRPLTAAQEALGLDTPRPPVEAGQSTNPRAVDSTRPVAPERDPVGVDSTSSGSAQPPTPVAAESNRVELDSTDTRATPVARADQAQSTPIDAARAVAVESTGRGALVAAGSGRPSTPAVRPGRGESGRSGRLAPARPVDLHELQERLADAIEAGEIDPRTGAPINPHSAESIRRTLGVGSAAARKIRHANDSS